MIQAPARSNTIQLATRLITALRFNRVHSNRRDEVAAVRFAWSPALVELRRQVCPNARWQKHSRLWLMQDDEAQSFMRAAQAALEYQKWHTQITVDDTVWIVGFVQGAPYRLTAARAA
jgi:hypothetical protein